jgi:heat-inducible transcriptional repressor
MEFSEREKAILGAIIDHYLSTGESVGSRTIEKKYNIELSSATIRNVMADLEDEGYIAKTHTSSGRAPTTKGYKYYLDTLLKIQKFSKEEMDKIESAYEKRRNELEDILEKTSHLLSKMSSYAGIAIETDVKSEKIRKIEIVHVSKFMLFAVIVTENNSVKTKKIHLEHPVTEEEAKDIEKKLNQNLKADKSNLLPYNIEKIINDDRIEPIESFARECIEEVDGDFFMEGAPSIIENLEKENPHEVTNMLKMLENKKDLKCILEKIALEQKFDDGRVNVIMGEDMNIKELEEFSFVFSTYTIGDSRGIIGVMGPKRMEYSRTVALVKYVGREVNKAIERLSLMKGEDDEDDEG